MAKRHTARPRGLEGNLKALQPAAPWLLGAVFFLAMALSAPSSIKGTAMAAMAAALVVLAVRLPVARARLGLPMLALALVVAMGGISTAYAVSGKFALAEFLKIMVAFCLALMLLVLAPAKEEREPLVWMGTVLETACALGGAVSVDLISTRWLSTPVTAFLGLFAAEYRSLPGVEAGVRMTGLFSNPNVFAGMVGLGVLLSLGLALGEDSPRRRAGHVVCLFVNAFSFVLAFSMGASAAIAVGFVVFLLLERRERRGEALVLMVETLILTVAAAGIVSATSFDAWTAPRPAPLLCLLAGAAALWALDRFVGRPMGEKLRARGTAVLLLLGAVAVGLAAAAVAACCLTGPAKLEGGEGLRRAIYPAPGEYTLELEASGAVSVSVESQDQRDTMMHTATVLYQGDAASARFTVPEGSRVVYLDFAAGEEVTISDARCRGAGGTEKIPLGYRLLPGFIANRLQGLWANQNAIQRTVFFADGLKLFSRSPVFGSGLGAFENGVKGVQSFYYETKYAHNHYIQTLAETGVIGLVLFVGMLLSCGAGLVLVRRRRGGTAAALVPALGAAVVFMALHAAEEVVFSAYAYLPVAFGTVAMIDLAALGVFRRERAAGKQAEKREKTARTAAVAVMMAGMAVFAGFLGGNLRARALVSSPGTTLGDLDQAIGMDRFEWADYMLSYIVSVGSADGEVSQEIRQQADTYAQRLSQVDSNTIPLYLSEYYFTRGREEQAFAMAEKYVDYVSADPSAWQRTFELLIRYERDTPVFRQGTARLAGKLAKWESENMGEIELTESVRTLIRRMGGEGTD